MKNESVWIFVINDKTRIIIYILSHIALYKHLYFKKEFRIPKSPNTKLPLLPFPNTFEEYNTTIKIRKIKSSDSPFHWFHFRPLENDSKARILASNYTVKVTKRTWDVCRRCTFAEEGGGPKGKKTEREREGEGRGRCTPQCGTTPDPIASSVSVLESSRSKRTSTDFGKRSLDNFLPHPFFPSGTNSRRYQEATKTSRIESLEDIRSQKERKEFVTTDRDYTCSSYSSYYPFLSPERKFTLHARNSKW